MDNKDLNDDFDIKQYEKYFGKSEETPEKNEPVKQYEDIQSDSGKSKSTKKSRATSAPAPVPIVPPAAPYA